VKREAFRPGGSPARGAARDTFPATLPHAKKCNWETAEGWLAELAAPPPSFPPRVQGKRFFLWQPVITFYPWHYPWQPVATWDVWNMRSFQFVGNFPGYKWTLKNPRV